MHIGVGEEFQQHARHFQRRGREVMGPTRNTTGTWRENVRIYRRVEGRPSSCIDRGNRRECSNRMFSTRSEHAHNRYR